MKYAMKDFSDAIEMLLRGPSHMKSVTVFCKPLSNVTQRVTATYKHKPDGRFDTREILVTYGAPNYSQREYLALCKKAKCNPRRVWFKFYPSKKRNKA